MEWAFADADRILIGYTVRSDDGRRFDPLNVRLADEAGALMPFTMSYGVTGHSDMLDVTLPPGEGTSVWVWRNESQGSAPGETLKLRLEMQAEELILPTPAPAPAGDPAASPAGPGSVLLEPLPAGKRLGPFTFELSIRVAGSAH